MNVCLYNSDRVQESLSITELSPVVKYLSPVKKNMILKEKKKMNQHLSVF